MRNECIIPPNFALEGVIAGGLKWRNVIEAGAIAILIGYPFFTMVPLPINAKIYIGVLGLLPVLIFAVIGIQGMSLMTYLFLFFKAFKNRRILTYPDSKAKIAREKKLLHKKQQRLNRMEKMQKKSCEDIKE